MTDSEEIMAANAEAAVAYHNMCAAVGHAISTWSNVESEMATIFATSLGGDFRAAIEVFYCAIGFDTKLRLANSVIRRNCAKRPDAIANWATLVNGYQDPRIDGGRGRSTHAWSP
jgi:hypothetical protein